MDIPPDSVFPTSAAASYGLSRNQLRGASFAHPFHGVVATGKLPDQMVMVKAALVAAGSDALLGGLTALQMWGAWLPERFQDARPIFVVIPPRRRGPRRTGIVVIRAQHVLPPVDIGDVWSVHPAQAWLQVAQLLDLTELTVLADFLMRRGSDLATRSDLEDVLVRSPRRSGVRRARAALELARAGVESPMESRLRLAIVDHGLPCPVVNHTVVVNYKEYRLDMAYVEALLGVEYDGRVHVQDRRQMEGDRTRRRQLEDAGWRVITVTSADFQDLDPVFASIRLALGSRGVSAWPMVH